MKFTVPLEVQVSSRKTLKLNLNVYRNAHWTQLDKAKKNFNKLALILLRGEKPIKPPIKMTFELWIPNATEVDLSNVCSVVDKFATDCVVKAGIIPDDNYKYLKQATYIYRGIDRKRPRCEITVEHMAVPELVLSDQIELEIEKLKARIAELESE